MELEYKNYSVRIVHNPNDVILRFTDNATMRMWESRLTERDFIEVQVLGGLEFAVSVLKGVLTSDSYIISDFKDTPKQLSFTVQYIPAHSKQINLDFVLPAIKRENANVDMETILKRIASLEKDLSEQKDISLTLRNELDEQTEKTSGYIILPGCPFAIHEDIVSLQIGLINTIDPVTNKEYAKIRLQHNGYNANVDSPMNLMDMIHEKRYYFNSLNNIGNLKFLKKCGTLSILDSDAKDFSPISEMTSLTNLSIIYSSANNNLSSIKWITTLTNLQSLIVYNCSGLSDATPLTQLKNLKALIIQGSGVQNTSMLSSSITITR
jgi:hypothetical protein